MNDFFSIVYFLGFIFLNYSAYLADIKFQNIPLFFIFLVTFPFAILFFFHILIYKIFIRLNGNTDYIFNPDSKSLTVFGNQDVTITKADIIKIEEFQRGGKWSCSFKVIYLSNQNTIILTDRLTFLSHFYEFFGEEIPHTYQQLGFLKGYQLLKSYL